MLNNTNINNRRMILSAAMLNIYPQNTKVIAEDDNDAGKSNEQITEQLRDKLIEPISEQDENASYVLGYN